MPAQRQAIPWSNVTYYLLDPYEQACTKQYTKNHRKYCLQNFGGLVWHGSTYGWFCHTSSQCTIRHGINKAGPCLSVCLSGSVNQMCVLQLFGVICSTVWVCKFAYDHPCLQLANIAISHYCRADHEPLPELMMNMLTHLLLDNMTAISQTVFSDECTWMNSLVFLLKFHSRLVQLTPT